MKAVCLLLVLCCVASVVYGWPTTVNLPGLGAIRGFKDAKGLNNFLGVPYAAPPVGDFRWRPPQAPRAWRGTLDTINFADSCTQFYSAGYTFPKNITFSENCLFINIWAPDTPTANKTVMFWIHGGGLTEGGNSELRLRGNYMALTGDVIVVNVGYRLGKIGFLANEHLTAEDPKYHSSGNYGFLDQRAALQWVQKYIHLFGGNPHDVTIMGESAGGSSVCYHIVSPGSKSLFSKAIAESSACFAEIEPLKTGEIAGRQLQHALNCSTGTPSQILSCLRSKPWADVLKANGNANLHIDNVDFHQTPYHSLQSKSFHVVPLMQGDVLNEGSYWVYGVFPKVILPSEYMSILQHYFKDLAPQVAEAYPCANYNKTDCRAAVTQAFGDYLLTCPTMILGQAFEQHNTYSYLFMHQPSWFNHNIYGVAHASEIEFVFSTVDIHPGYTRQEVALANGMTRHWVHFAKSGNPNYVGQQVHWPRFEGENAWSRMGLQERNHVVRGYEVEQCAFWRQAYNAMPSLYAEVKGKILSRKI
eukprot:TRINITY_DN1872_c0_g1_i1.p1 TRINITY_DN1872_c0_g1~~TRINITY_DN1872_c0_g1_i1.p1  ORF type:complete len:530 (-),score=80.04 TRINITY_DN1872_c0_g1_i1:67-1656(-)